MERKKVIDMTLEEMAGYSFDEIRQMMDEDYEEDVKRMKQEYEDACARQMEILTSSNRIIEESKDELPSIRFDLSNAREIVKIIRNTIKKTEEPGLIDYNYLPDKNRDSISMDIGFYSSSVIGGFWIYDMYGNPKHIVILYSNGSVKYTHEIPRHIGIGTKYHPDFVYRGWYCKSWTIPADEVWDLIPKLDPR